MLQEISFGQGASTGEVRQPPCEARGVGPHTQACGATPASLWERYCRNGHIRLVRLCPSHANIVAMGYAACTECIEHGTSAEALIRPKDLILLDHFGV